MSLLSRSQPASRPLTPKEKAEHERQRKRRFLVIGSEGHGRAVDERRWDRLEGLTVSDYDVVIINFVVFAEDPELATGLPPERLPEPEAMTRLLFSPGSEIIAIGDPRTLIGPPPSHEPGQLNLDSRRRADYWLPMQLEVEEQTGTAFEALDSDWSFYFEALAEYGWLASGRLHDQFGDAREYLAPVTDDANGLKPSSVPLAQTRFGKAIALRLAFTAERHFLYSASPAPTLGGGTPVAEPLLESGSVIWLPAPQKLSVAESIDAILRERYGLAAPARVPTWAADYTLPAEAPIVEEIERLNGERADIEEQIAAARERASEAAAPRGLLYEKDESLELLGRAALRELGAEVSEPTQRGREDGILRCGPRLAALEVKGRSGPIKERDVRQAVQWASDAQLDSGETHKPLILANPHCETDPAERGAPLAPNALRSAENGGVAVLLTSQLFAALREIQEDRFDANAFWAALFAARGLVTLPATVLADETEAELTES